MLGGTIRYALENLGRTLLYVDFDSGQSVMVLAADVTYDGADDAPDPGGALARR